ncbi:MAG: FAD:protein FMN transferase [Neisseria sp.]|nr:FAD:protein FMN transferase [Neisseria sp.]
MYGIAFQAMGCHMEALLDSDDLQAAYALNAVAAQFAAWEQSFSRFRCDSELSLLNQKRQGVVSEDLWQVLQAACGMARFSTGLVTPLAGKAVRQAGYAQSFVAGWDIDAPEENVTVADWQAILFDAKRRHVTLPPEADLDLGGMAKGWCAHKAVEDLGRFAPALVDAGGDIAVSGALRDGSAWEVALGRREDKPTAFLFLDQGAVATSGRDVRHWRKNGRLHHHIIDPRTGQPAQSDVMRATVVAEHAVLAEAAAKVILIQGSSAGLAWATQQGLAACVWSEQGWQSNDVFAAGGFRQPVLL